MGSQNINNHVIFITLLPRTSINEKTLKNNKWLSLYYIDSFIKSLFSGTSANITALKRKCSLLPLKDTAPSIIVCDVLNNQNNLYLVLKEARGPLDLH